MQNKTKPQPKKQTNKKTRGHITLGFRWLYIIVVRKTCPGEKHKSACLCKARFSQ